MIPIIRLSNNKGLLLWLSLSISTAVRRSYLHCTFSKGRGARKNGVAHPHSTHSCWQGTTAKKIIDPLLLGICTYSIIT